MAIQQSPEKMLPLSDIYKVNRWIISNFIDQSLRFSLSLIDFLTIEQIHKNGRILFDIISRSTIVSSKFHVDSIDQGKEIIGHCIASKYCTKHSRNSIETEVVIGTTTSSCHTLDQLHFDYLLIFFSSK